ncbi:radical SAM protein [Helicobacter sp. MIT 11-5569]|uniref:radical SAM protein n=1 Tax=Helicobacter sp. MIT 11-5569 TaxID=1548151 RepID=UPI000ABB5487|nr:radical SAM protein [Helicobacter sp. MIT 11-5569]TLD84604.1 radical SAM protein [Helicobacter sp. MIT 11-5569]
MEGNLYDGEPPKALPKEQIERIGKYLLKNRRISSATIHLTSKCNYTCPMCPFHGKGYNEGVRYFKDNPALKAEITLENVINIIDKVSDYGIERISFTSQGEALLHPRILEIIKYCKEKDIYTTLTSNGAVVDDTLVKQLKEAGLDAIDFSIDSVDKMTYSKVRSANDRDYKRAISAPIKTRKAGIYTSIQFTEQKDNKGQFNDILKYYLPYGINQIRNAFECEMDNNGFKRKEVYIKNNEYFIGLCGSNEYIILLDGTLIGCCAMMYFYNQAQDRLPNVLKDSSFEESLQKLHFFLAEDKFMQDKCRKCAAYVPSVAVLQKQKIENGYFVFEYTDGRELRFIVPEPLRILPNDILLWMYKNNIVTMMKKDKIL